MNENRRRLTGITLTFGIRDYRIESNPNPNTGKSHLRLYRKGECIFEGSYGKLADLVYSAQNNIKEENN